MTPKQIFESNFRLAELLLNVYRMLENEHLITEGDLLAELRKLVAARANESLLLILNSIFMGLIREEANIPPATLKPESLSNLLRQAVVSGCTAYETYLFSILQENIHTVIDLKQHEFFPADADVNAYFKDLSFSIGDAFRLLSLDERSLFLGNKIVTYVQKKNLGSTNGLKTVGMLLGLEDPWGKVSEQLQREKNEIMRAVRDCLERRNAIVHRGDRIEEQIDQRQPITYAWTEQAVHTVRHVCLGFDEIIRERMNEYQQQLQSEAAETV